MNEISPRVEGFCASCERVLWLAFEEQRLLVHAEQTGPEVAECPDCGSALRSETVLSGAELDRREIRRLMEAMTGEPYAPVVEAQRWEELLTTTVKARAGVEAQRSEE